MGGLDWRTAAPASSTLKVALVGFPGLGTLDCVSSLAQPLSATQANMTDIPNLELRHRDRVRNMRSGANRMVSLHH
jgi:hypothetical protein